MGALLYELLTGRPPFRAPTLLDTVLQVLGEEPVAPAQLQPRTPRDLESICLKCLEKEPCRRYASARELADDLGRFGGGEPVRARPIGRLARGGRWCKRNPAVAALLAAVAIVLLTGAAVATVFAVLADRRARAEEKARQEVRAKQEATRAQQERDRAAGLIYAGQLALAPRASETNNVLLFPGRHQGRLGR